MNRVTLVLAVALVFVISPQAESLFAVNSASLGNQLLNSDMESGSVGDAPLGWSIPERCASDGYYAISKEGNPHEGRRCARLSYRGEREPSSFGNLMQTIDATDFRGKRLQLKAALRVKGDGRARMWMRVELNDGRTGFLDTMENRAVTDSDWSIGEINGVVADDAETISVGFMLFGNGAVFIDTVSLEEIEEAPPGLTEEQLRLELESFDYVWAKIRDAHWDPDIGGVDWAAVRDELRPRCEEASSTREASAIIEEMLDRIGESHFGIIPRSIYQSLEEDEESSDEDDSDDNNDSDNSDDSGQEGNGEGTTESSDSGDTSSKKRPEQVDPSEKDRSGHPGFQAVLVDQEFLVSQVDEGGPAAAAGVELGWQVVSVNGRSMEKMIENLSEVYEKPAQLRLYAGIFMKRRLSGPPESSMDIVFRNGQDQEEEKAIALAKPKGKIFSLGNLPPFEVWLESHRVGDDVGYITFNSFMDPMRIMGQFEEAMKSFKDCAGIIIDIRGNGGGIGFMANGLSNHFVKGSGLSLGTMKTRTTEIKFVIFPRVKPYMGPIAVLIDGGSASTSEIFAGGLQEMGRARIFGTQSAGAALPSVVEPLPNGDRFQYAIADFTTPKGVRLEGVGVIPDEVLDHSKEALLKGHDVVIQAAVDWIHSEAQKSK